VLSASAMVSIPGKQDQKFVAADSGDGILLAELRLQAVSDLAQEKIAEGVAQGIINQLEAIKIQEQKGVRRFWCQSDNASSASPAEASGWVNPSAHRNRRGNSPAAAHACAR